MKCAIATLCVGERLQHRFRQAFLPTWENYCQRHKLELVVLEGPIDSSPRARGRSPAWQKCLVHQADVLGGYDRIAWLDADIVVSPEAPNVFDAVPADFIGAVDDHATPSADEHRLVTERAYQLWTSQGIAVKRCESSSDWYHMRQIQCDSPHVVQTGMFVFSPHAHGAILERAYNLYDDLGDDALNHEMGALSYEMIRSGHVFWLPAKFNMMWICYQLLHYPFLENPRMIPGRLPISIKRKIAEYMRGPCVRTALRNNYFLHFSGGSGYYKCL